MALVSPVKTRDLVIYADLAECALLAYNYYEKTQDEAILEQIQALAEGMERLDRKIKTHDYSTEDNTHWRVDKDLTYFHQ